MNSNFPNQRLSDKKKTEAWKKSCVDWGADSTSGSVDAVRSTIRHKKINYDLLNGKLHMEDLERLINPTSLDSKPFEMDDIPHYPIMNAKLNILIGEEIDRPFTYTIVPTNPNAVSEIEEAKKKMFFEQVTGVIEGEQLTDEQMQEQMRKIQRYANYEYQDINELQDNELLRHYVKEYNIPAMFVDGYRDALCVAEEIYQVYISGGEPRVRKLNPMNVSVFGSGYSNRIEDADVVVINEYWNKGRIIDEYHEELSDKDIKAIEEMTAGTFSGSVDSMGNIDYTKEFIHKEFVGEEGVAIDADEYYNGDEYNTTAVDNFGNIRVVQVFWKSFRRIKLIKRYDMMTGEETYKFMEDDYVAKKELGEEEKEIWINEAWEGTRIGKDIYVGMHPCRVQFSSMGNPSKCHFGIIGQIYNINGNKPYSLVDMMKEYNYHYDVIHARLNVLIARDWGNLVEVDLAKLPNNWTVDEWVYFAKNAGISVKDSFKQGATGVMAGGLNNASSGVIQGAIGNTIQMYISILEYIKSEMQEVVGISKQREGQISNRETVGGVERATLQSSHITEYYFHTHADTKRRVMNAFLDVLSICKLGKNEKFQYIADNNIRKMAEVNGTAFAAREYGMLADNDQDIKNVSEKLDMMAQAAMQNNKAKLSTVIKMYRSCSLAEKQRLLEADEEEARADLQQQQQQQLQVQQQANEMAAQQKQADMALRDTMNQRDNETKLLIARLSAQSLQKDYIPDINQEDKSALLEKMREFDKNLALEREKFEFDKKNKTEANEIKRMSVNKRTANKK